ncbi:unnamed protein product [Dracunculus medinensis]|uniref:DUF2158 domain-containing protein n=1 Tax=Dracunculus medinensis TaxID=318479 RepID=A0A0N4U2P6_DRAME|nr:unnamed protein product [Dracunculus medinensis]
MVTACRSECLEMNKHKIVRVHLKDGKVHAGVCRNVTKAINEKALSHVFPFVCDKEIGLWEVDEQANFNCDKN